jgi:hypothetical protein
MGGKGDWQKYSCAAAEIMCSLHFISLESALDFRVNFLLNGRSITIHI